MRSARDRPPASNAAFACSLCAQTFPSGMGLPVTEAPPAQPMLLAIATAAPLRPELYKTQLCKWWMSSGTCQHGADCQFAHGYHQQVGESCCGMILMT